MLLHRNSYISDSYVVIVCHDYSVDSSVLLCVYVVHNPDSSSLIPEYTSLVVLVLYSVLFLYHLVQERDWFHCLAFLVSEVVCVCYIRTSHDHSFLFFFLSAVMLLGYLVQCTCIPTPPVNIQLKKNIITTNLCFLNRAWNKNRYAHITLLRRHSIH